MSRRIKIVRDYNSNETPNATVNDANALVTSDERVSVTLHDMQWLRQELQTIKNEFRPREPSTINIMGSFGGQLGLTTSKYYCINI
jgi:hypothetical protein